MNTVKICGAALLALSALLVLKGQKSEFYGMTALAASVLLLGAAVSAFLPVLEQMREAAEGTAFSPYIATIGKALGITWLVQFSADICRDAGEGGLGAKLEMAGKAELLILALPLIGELMALAQEVMG